MFLEVRFLSESSFFANICEKR